MAKRTKAEQQEYQDTIARLREWIKPGDTVYTILRQVSRTGMSRQISVVVSDGQGGFLHPNYAVALAIGAPLGRSGGSDAIRMSGCGMDMGFALVYELSHRIYPEYTCLGKRTDGSRGCPSPYHTNHRDRIACPGTIFAGATESTRCYKPNAFNHRFPIPEQWPRAADRVLTGEETGQTVTLPGELLACVRTFEDDGEYVVCATCQGEGTIPNPDGPERWDLTHQDGYALRQAWL